MSNGELEPSKIGILMSSAQKLIDFKGLFIAAKESDQDDADNVWNHFVTAFDDVVEEFKEEIRASIIESGEYDELPDGKFVRKPSILDSQIIGD